MRIAVLYNRDIYALKALNLLLPALAGHDLALFHSSRVGRASDTEPELLRSLAAFERDALEKLLAGGATSIAPFDDLACVARANDQALNHVNQPEGLVLLQQFQPDLMLSIRFGKILREAAIAVSRHGVLNLHSGLLPAYRGVMPTFWAMLAGEPSIGTTLHWVPDATIDTGPAIAMARADVASERSYVSHVWRLYEVGIPTMIQAVAAIQNYQLTKNQPVLNAVGASHYFTFPTAEAITAFEGKGLSLFERRDLDDMLAG